jgi:RND family efflux transporter MFP subunit
MDREALNALKRDRTDDNGPEPIRKGWFWAILIIVIFAAGGAVAWASLGGQPLKVKTATATVSGGGGGDGSGVSVLNASGYVVATQEAAISSQIVDKIEKVTVDEGDHLKKGQVVAYLDNSSYKAAVDEARSALATDRAAIEKAKATLALDKITLKRQQKLLPRRATSQSAVDKANAAVNVDQAALAQAKAKLGVDQQALNAANVELSYTVLHAPFDGVVTEKYAHPGEMISPAAVGGYTQTGICHMVDMKSLEVDVDVNEAYIQRVHKGMRTEAVLDAYPNWRIPSHVISVVPTANKEKATIKVRIAFNKLDPRIVPEMGVQVWFYNKKPKAGENAPAFVSVPAKAVRGSGADRYVYVVNDGKAQRQPVKTGSRRGDAVRVTSGLSGGEQVIVSAPKNLHDGEKVAEAK